MTPRVEPGALCHHIMRMNRLALIAAFLSAAGLLHAQDKSKSPAAAPAPIEISGNDGGALTEKSGTSNPKMNKDVDVASTTESEGPFDIEPPPGSPDPAKTPELTGPLPGEEDPRPMPPVTGTVEISAKDNGRVVAAKVGDLLRITLESNPSTGYNWELRGFDFGVAVFHGSELKARSGGNVLFGAPGDTIMTLQAVEPGKQNIELVYRRPWEAPDQIAARFGFLLEVLGTPTPQPSPSPVPSPAP